MAGENEATIIYQVTDEHMRKIATDAVAEFARTHACRFSDKTAGRVLAFDRACEEHNVTEGDLMVMVFSAKTAHGIVQSAAKKMFYTILILALLAWAYFSGLFTGEHDETVKAIHGVVK